MCQPSQARYSDNDAFTNCVRFRPGSSRKLYHLARPVPGLCQGCARAVPSSTLWRLRGQVCSLSRSQKWLRTSRFSHKSTMSTPLHFSAEFWDASVWGCIIWMHGDQSPVQYVTKCRIPSCKHTAANTLSVRVTH